MLHNSYRNKIREKCKEISINGIDGIDECIKDLLLNLWDNNIETLESCCGHNTHEVKIRIADPLDLEKTKRIIIANGIYDFSVQYNQDISIRVTRDDKINDSICYREETSFITRNLINNQDE